MENTEQANTKAKRNVSLLGLRTKMPQIVRYVAIFAFAATILGIGIAFYRARSKEEFRMKGMPTELSKDVKAVVMGFERREVENDVLKYYIKADKATTFADNHQELENVYLEAYDESGQKFDKISASKAIYIPNESNSKLFTAFFSGNVDVKTRDTLNVKSEELSYDRESEIVESEVLIEFARGTVSGKSFGAIAKIREKRLELLKDVEINAFADNSGQPNEVAKANIQRAKIISGRAVFDQGQEKIDLEQNVFINLIPLNASGQFSQPTDIRAERAIALFEAKEIRKFDLTGNVEVFAKPVGNNPKYAKTRANHAIANFDKELTRVELEQNVDIETAQEDGRPAKIKSQYAVYDKAADRFELKNGAEIITVEDNLPTTTRSNDAVYLQADGKIFLTGNAEVTQGKDLIKGDSLTAELFPNKKLKNAFSKGNAYLKQAAPDRTTEVSASEITANFGENQQILKANVTGSPNVAIIPTNANEYSKAAIVAARSIQLNFLPTANDSVLNQLLTDGRTSINLSAAQGDPKAANRKLEADTVNTTLQSNGKDIAKVQAIGNAEFYIEPVKAAPENYKTTITASRFDCDFYETGNNLKICTATKKSKAVMQPTAPAQNRGTRTLVSEKMVANFDKGSSDISRFDASGAAKYTELDRNGTAAQITYTRSDEIVRFRGGEPQVWDSRARAKAGEIDWDTKNEKSFLRRKVTTTYYNQKQTNGATPFTKVNAPVFITADQAQFDHQREVGIYSGNARAWQDNNYVRADNLVINQIERTLDGEGKVQSLLYNAKRRENGKEISQPAFASANKLSYSDKNKLIHYEGNVDIRQGADRIIAGVADIYLDENNDLRQTLAQNDVVITQPGRRASGTWVQYDAASDVFLLKGNPAKVDDAARGSSQGSQLTVSAQDNKVVSEGATKPNAAGRTRTVYKVKKAN